MNAPARLQNWLEAAQMRPSEMARRCGYDRSNMHKVISGALRPSLNLAAAIERETSGAIRAADWADAQGRDAPAKDRAA